jgi:hypothetical protein
LSAAKAQVFAKLYAPNLDAPVLTLKLERPAADKNFPLKFGVTLAQLTRCVATASGDSVGSKLTTLPEAALLPWAKFCEQYYVGPAAAAPLLQMIARGEPVSADALVAVAAAGYPDETATGFETLVAKDQVFDILYAHGAPLVAARKTATSPRWSGSWG